MSVARLKLPLCQMWNHATNDLLTRQYQSFVTCTVEMNLAWNVTGTERFTLYYDSVEELGRLACFKSLFFALSRNHFRIEYVAFTLLTRGLR